MRKAPRPRDLVAKPRKKGDCEMQSSSPARPPSSDDGNSPGRAPGDLSFLGATLAALLPRIDRAGAAVRQEIRANAGKVRTELRLLGQPADRPTLDRLAVEFHAALAGATGARDRRVQALYLWGLCWLAREQGFAPEAAAGGWGR
jgi:hypothetical protein